MNETRRERLQNAPVSTLSKALIRRIIYAGHKMGLVPSVVTAKTFWGEKIRTPIFCFPQFLFRDELELKLSKFLMSTLKKGEVFVDGGANLGFFSVLAASLGAKVYAFEPSVTTFGVLRQNAKGRNIDARQVALWNSHGTMKLNDFGDNKAGCNTLLSDPTRVHYYDELFQNVKQYEVPTVTLDELGLKPTVIKLDCEGAEWEILQGATETLKSRPILIVEMLKVSRENGMTTKIMDLLGGIGYKAHYIADDFTLVPLGENNHDIVDVIFKT